MTPHSKILKSHYMPLISKRNQRAFFAYLQQVCPQAQETSHGMVIGDPNSAKLILSIRPAGDLSAVIAMTELVGTLSAPFRQSLCFCLSDKPTIFPDKLHIRIGNISKGDMMVLGASPSARKLWGQALKKTFLPNEAKALCFKKAESVLHRFSDWQCEIFITSKKQLHLFRPNPPVQKQLIDTGSVKLVCDGVLRLLKTI